jgi:GT2 family glycosyltransferase
LLFNCLAENPDVGHVAPVLLKRGTEDEVEWAGTLIGKWGMSHITIGIGQNVLSIPPGLTDVDFIPGGCNFGSAQMFRKVGLQDERLFMYGDEMDFDTRVKRAGYRVAILGEARAWHEHIDPEYQRTVSRSDRRSALVLYLAKLGNINSERETPPWIIYLVNRNRVLITRWHRSWPRFLVFAFLTLIKIPLGALIWWLVYSPKHAWAFLLGKWDGFRGISGKPVKLMDDM